MAVFVIDCPHCGEKRCTFNVKASTVDPHERSVYSVIATCSGCAGPATFVVKGIGHDPAGHVGNVLENKTSFRLVNVFPGPPVLDIPADLPNIVAKAFEQAELARHAGVWDAAAAMYQKAMELGLKDLSPGIAHGKSRSESKKCMHRA